MVNLTTGLQGVVSMIDSGQSASLIKTLTTGLSQSKNLVEIGRNYAFADIAEFIEFAGNLVGLHQLVSGGDLANARTVASLMAGNIPELKK